MGACVSTDSGSAPVDKSAKLRNKQIEDQINADRKKLRDEVKLLLLGPGESGKSTIFKQLKLLNYSKFKKEELDSWKRIVHLNLVSQMKVLCTAANKLCVDQNSDEARSACTRMLNLSSEESEEWSNSIGKDIKILWADSGIRTVFDERDKQYQLNDSAFYFFDNIDRVMEDGYKPTIQDILRARVRSIGIEEAKFKLEEFEFKMVDVGGQRSERRKWLHCFSDVTAVLFCASLSEYDQTLREDPTQNRMKESLLLFEEICNAECLSKVAFILFLNKTDLLEKKISEVDELKTLFSKYKGGCDPEAAMAFIKERYTDLNPASRTIYSHFTCALDTQGIMVVFSCVKETLLKDVLADMF